MTQAENRTKNYAGPVIDAGHQNSEAVLRALQADNPDLEIVARPGYRRAEAPLVCILNKKTVESLLGFPFSLPSDLEEMMPAFKGTLEISEEQALWKV